MLSSNPTACGSICTAPRTAYVHYCPHRLRARRLCCATAQANFETKANEFKQAATNKVKEAARKWEKFAAQHELEGKARKVAEQASARAKEAAGDVKDAARRFYMKMDSEYHLEERSARLQRKVKEGLTDIDQQYHVRRKVKSLSSEVQRKLPEWQMQLNRFGQTPLGKATIIVAIVMVITSGAFWTLLNFFWLLWALSLPIALLTLDSRRRQQEAAATAQQEWTETSSTSRGTRSSLGDIFANWGSDKGAPKGSSKFSGQQPGPIIDAEWVSLDEADSPSRRRK